MTHDVPPRGSPTPDMTYDPSRGVWDPHPGVRSGRRLTVGERTADLVARAAGTWSYLVVLATAMTVAATVAVWQDDRAGAVAMLSLVLSALALIEISLVLMAGRRAERNTGEAALYDLDQGRRATALAEDLRAEVHRLHEDVARLAAQAERAAIPAQPPADRRDGR
jgi:uncharacterized membrane protein